MNDYESEMAWLDSLDPAAIEWRDAVHLREVISAAKALDDARRRLRDAVAGARAAGDSWTQIGMALGTSRQNAQQRFGR